MTDQSANNSAPSQPPPPRQTPRRHGHFRRFLMWMRDYDSPAAHEHYANMGIWSSRVYAVVILLVVPLAQWLSQRESEATMLWLTISWCLIWDRAYLWYQAKEILAYDVVEEQHASRDLMNSILPAISLGILIGVWIIFEFLLRMGWATFDLRYSQYGWVIIASAAWDVIYDLRINTRITLVLSKVPGRVEYGAPQPPSR